MTSNERRNWRAAVAVYRAPAHPGPYRSPDEITRHYRAAFARQKRRERIRERLFGIALVVFFSGLFGVLIGLAAGR